jgi:2-polyprenyl-6-methoxyphenol hydroxylase-like FAD-dependent oxidoreductase
MYDVIVIGARCAGSPLSTLLARKGYRVLLVDRATFPSDTISTHVVHIKGGAALRRWGVFDTVLRSNAPLSRHAQFHVGPVKIEGDFPPLGGVDGVICPRRTVLDKIMVDAAVEAGVELLEDVLVEELIAADGRVMGVRGRGKASRVILEERARVIIGADGKHSLVARTVKAPEYHTYPVLTCAYYTYWSGLDLSGGELYSLMKTSIGLWPTNNGLAMIYIPFPITEFNHLRRNIEECFWQTVKQVPGLTERLRNGRQAERFFGTADLPSFYRRPYGPGWALVGDAGMTMDPITGLGISHAFRDAERLAEALDRVLCGQEEFDAAMAKYEQARNADTLPSYKFTAMLASFPIPGVEQREMFAALARNPDAVRQFLGVLTGSVSPAEFFAPSNLFRILGPTGMSRILFDKLASFLGRFHVLETKQQAGD